MSKKFQKVIAIDGPSGSGKSTLAKKVASTLGILYVDTGSMFRSVALILHRLGINLDGSQLSTEDSLICERLFSHSVFEYAKTPDELVVIDGEDLTQQIREHSVSSLSSKASQFPLVRTFMADWQRKVAQDRFCVLEGRDIGTVIFPNALLKVFLVAAPEVRAKRRLEELDLRGEFGHNYEEILNDIIERDRRDSTRVIAPLKKASDAIELDTSNLDPEQVLARVVDLYQKRLKDTDETDFRNTLS